MSNVVYFDFASRRAVASEPTVPTPLVDVEDRPVAAELRASVESQTCGQTPAPVYEQDFVIEHSAEGLNRSLVERARQAAAQLHTVRDDAEDLARRSQQMRQETQNLTSAILQLGQAIKRLEDLPRQARAIVEAAS